MRYEGALRSPIYDLCRQTVTVYHACYNPFRVTRCVIHGAYFERKTVQTVDKSGGKSCDEFLLVIPNKNARRAAPALFNGIPGVYVLECGDRIVEGVGEEITTREQWGSFVPANRPGVVTADWVRDMGCTTAGTAHPVLPNRQTGFCADSQGAGFAAAGAVQYGALPGRPTGGCL